VVTGAPARAHPRRPRQRILRREACQKDCDDCPVRAVRPSGMCLSEPMSCYSETGNPEIVVFALIGPTSIRPPVPADLSSMCYPALCPQGPQVPEQSRASPAPMCPTPRHLDRTCPKVPEIAAIGSRDTAGALTLKRQQARSQPLLSLAMPAPPVIIEPDSLGPWLGLIGVVTGVAITTAINWLQNRRRDRAECESTRTCAGCRLSREFVTTGWLDPVQVGVLQEPAPSMRRQSRERVQRPLR
jgi:hypothetical protein